MALIWQVASVWLAQLFATFVLVSLHAVNALLLQSSCTIRPVTLHVLIKLTIMEPLAHLAMPLA